MPPPPEYVREQPRRDGWCVLIFIGEKKAEVDTLRVP
jgi:hypothetical protein